MLLHVLRVSLIGLLLTAQQAIAQETDTSSTLTYPGRILRGDGQTCSISEEKQQLRNFVSGNIRSLLQSTTFALPSTEPCGGDGWRRIAYLNMTDPTQHCPHPWTEYSFPKRSCGRSTRLYDRCDSVIYGSNGISYTKVCGRIIGYQVGATDAFFYSLSDTPDSRFVDGVVVTRGFPRIHVWTFASGYSEVSSSPQYVCPCANLVDQPTNIRVPSFVGRNYFCESGTADTSVPGGKFYGDDPLWDGQGCGPTNNCCSFNSPPWFTVELTIPSSDDIEVRICSSTHEDTPVELMELYVQ